VVSTGQSLHLGRPRSPSPYGATRSADNASGDDLRRSQTMRVEKPGAAKPAAPKAAPADAGTD